MLDDSSTRPPLSLAYLTSLLEGIGAGDSWEVSMLCIAGSRKGSTPVGDAWLFEEMSRWSMPAIFRNVYDFVRRET